MAKTHNGWQAAQEGWELSNIGDRVVLRRLDPDESDIPLAYTEPPIFASDFEALIFVARKANEGSEYHRTALSFAGCRIVQAPD